MNLEQIKTEIAKKREDLSNKFSSIDSFENVAKLKEYQSLTLELQEYINTLLSEIKEAALPIETKQEIEEYLSTMKKAIHYDYNYDIVTIELQYLRTYPQNDNSQVVNFFEPGEEGDSAWRSWNSWLRQIIKNEHLPLNIEIQYHIAIICMHIRDDVYSNAIFDELSNRTEANNILELLLKRRDLNLLLLCDVLLFKTLSNSNKEEFIRKILPHPLCDSAVLFSVISKIPINSPINRKCVGDIIHHPKVNVAVLANLARRVADSNLLDSIINHVEVNHKVLKKLAMNKNADLAFLIRIKDHSKVNFKVLNYIASHPQADLALLNQILSHQQVTSEVLEKLVMHPQADLALLNQILSHQQVTSEVLEKLVMHPQADLALLHQILSHQQVTPEVLENLVMHPQVDLALLNQILSYQQVTSEVLDKLVMHPQADLALLDQILSHQQVTSEVLDKLVMHPQADLALLNQILSHQQVTSELLEKLAIHPEADRTLINRIISHDLLDRELLILLADLPIVKTVPQLLEKILIANQLTFDDKTKIIIDNNVHSELIYKSLENMTISSDNVVELLNLFALIQRRLNLASDSYLTFAGANPMNFARGTDVITNKIITFSSNFEVEKGVIIPTTKMPNFHNFFISRVEGKRFNELFKFKSFAELTEGLQNSVANRLKDRNR